MAMMKAPYNFVPLSDKVVFPEWADQISHDLPFSDGISGKIEIEIEAKTPIFVRNGYRQNADRESEEYKSFSHFPEGGAFIPATSIKGELRKLFEVLSFSKMQLIDNKRYGIRDLHNSAYCKSLPYESVHCGWMTLFRDGRVEIADMGIPYRISHKTIDEHFETRFCELFGEHAKIKDANRTAEYKYIKANEHGVCNQVYLFTEYTLYPKSASVDKRKGVRFSDNGQIRGRIVFTGQPGNRKERTEFKKAQGKFFEFVFPETENPVVFRMNDDDELFKDFLFIYKDSSDWAYWQKRARGGERVPVFFKVESGTLSSIGLSYLYKLPFKKRVIDFLSADHQSKRMDMAECVFGSINGNNALKGRVHVSHALCTEERAFDAGTIAPYMSSPKPTFYPSYLCQKGTGGYIDGGNYVTMMNNDAKLRGWKYYPVRNDSKKRDFDVPKGQEDNTNPACPLGCGSKFLFTVSFFNLKKIELGALLYAITLRNGSCHSLGFAKPFGYGACSYTIKRVCGFDELTKEDLMNQFVDYMESKIGDYKRSEQLKELFLMLNPHSAERVKQPLKYMEINEFVGCKRSREYLQNYSELLKPIETKPKETETLFANVAVFSGATKQVRLIDHKDKSKKELDMNGKKDKLKVGDKIIVELMSGGKKARFIKKYS